MFIREFWRALRRPPQQELQASWKQVFDREHKPLPVCRGPRAYAKNLAFFRQTCGESEDIICHDFSAHGRKYALFYVDGMNVRQFLEQDVLTPLLSAPSPILRPDQLPTSDVEVLFDLKDGLQRLLGGDVLLLGSGFSGVWVLGLRSVPTRSISENQRENVIYGPRESFTESIRTNTGLLRRRLRDPNLVLATATLGRRSQGKLVMAYIKGLADAGLVAQVLAALEQVDVDLLGDASQLEQYLYRRVFSPFPRTENSERPDAAAMALCQGQVVLLVDGSPSVLILPTTLGGLMTASEDHYRNWILTSLTRLIRWLAVAVALFLPSLYVVVLSYHPGIIPVRLEIVSAANRVHVPLTAAAEVMLMQFAVGLLREASLRMPKGLSQTLGVVGGIIIGDAAISAGIVSPFLVLVISLTTLASFALPNYGLAAAFRVAQYVLFFASCALGLTGLALGTCVLVGHLAGLDSFGLPYLQPLSPGKFRAQSQVFLRWPQTWVQSRPAVYRPLDRIRQKKGDA